MNNIFLTRLDPTQMEEWTALSELETPTAPDGAKLQLSLFYSLVGDMFEAKKFVDEVKVVSAIFFD